MQLRCDSARGAKQQAHCATQTAAATHRRAPRRPSARPPRCRGCLESCAAAGGRQGAGLVLQRGEAAILAPPVTCICGGRGPCQPHVGGEARCVAPRATLRGQRRQRRQLPELGVDAPAASPRCRGRRLCAGQWYATGGGRGACYRMQAAPPSHACIANKPTCPATAAHSPRYPAVLRAMPTSSTRRGPTRLCRSRASYASPLSRALQAAGGGQRGRGVKYCSAGARTARRPPARPSPAACDV